MENLPPSVLASRHTPPTLTGLSCADCELRHRFGEVQRRQKIRCPHLANQARGLVPGECGRVSLKRGRWFCDPFAFRMRTDLTNNRSNGGSRHVRFREQLPHRSLVAHPPLHRWLLCRVRDLSCRTGPDLSETASASTSGLVRQPLGGGERLHAPTTRRADPAGATSTGAVHTLNGSTHAATGPFRGEVVPLPLGFLQPRQEFGEVAGFGAMIELVADQLVPGRTACTG